MATPTFGQMQHFFALVAEGKITDWNFQTFLGYPNTFFEDNGFPVTVDYRLSLTGMIAAGKYDRKSEDIVSKNFAIDGKGKVETKLRLVYLGWGPSTKQVEERLASLDLVPAKIEHLLVFGSKYPEMQQEFPIAAIGSTWVRSDGRRDVPFLGKDGSSRCLLLYRDVPWRGWDADYRFLAVSK